MRSPRWTTSQVRHGVPPPRVRRSDQTRSAHRLPGCRRRRGRRHLPWSGRRRGCLSPSTAKKVTDAPTLAGQIGLAKAMRKYDLHRTISFHSRVKRAREFAASMPEVLAWMPARQRPKGELWSSYASGEMTAGERLRVAPAPGTPRRRRTGSARQRPLPGGRCRRADTRRRCVHRPSSIRGGHRPGGRACHPQVRGQDHRHHRHPGFHRH